MDLKKVCRVCLLPSESMLSVFSLIQVPRMPSLDLIERKILELLKMFTEILISPNDGLPDNICCDCLGKVRQLYAFKLKMEKSEAMLKQLHVDENKAKASYNFRIKLKRSEASLKQLKDVWNEGVSKVIKSPNEVEHYTETDIQLIKSEKIEDLEIAKYGQLESTSLSQIYDNCLTNQEIGIVQEVKQEPEIEINIDQEDYNETDRVGKNCKTTNLQCALCTKIFKNKTNLKAHMITHTDERPFQCKLCPTKLRSKSNLTLHIRRLHDDDTVINKKFQCAICLRFFGRRYDLHKHTKIHTGEKPFQCEFCSKKYRCKSQLTVHMRIHGTTKNTEFKCATCSKLFINMFQLNRHMLIHTEERPFRCDVCQKNFRHMDGLRTHTRTAHAEKVSNNDTRNIKKFECSICLKLFGRRDNLNTHMTVHSGERPFHCEFCPQKKFRAKRGLTEHMNAIHNYRKFECSKCSLLCKSRYLLKRHMLIHSEQRASMSKNLSI